MDEQDQLCWIEDHIAPVILDLDFTHSESFETVRQIKRIHAGIPVIPIGNQLSLASFSVVQMDSADAFFLKQTFDANQMAIAITASLERISTWSQLARQFEESL